MGKSRGACLFNYFIPKQVSQGLNQKLPRKSHYRTAFNGNEQSSASKAVPISHYTFIVLVRGEENVCFHPAFVSQAAAWLLVLMTASDVMAVTAAYGLKVKLISSL